MLLKLIDIPRYVQVNITKMVHKKMFLALFFLDTTAYIVEMKILSSFFFLFALRSFGCVDIYDNSNRFMDRDDNSINYANMEKNLLSQTIIQSNVDYNFLSSENCSSVKKWYFKPYFYKILCYYGNRRYIVLNLNYVVCPMSNNKMLLF